MNVARVYDYILTESLSEETLMMMKSKLFIKLRVANILLFFSLFLEVLVASGFLSYPLIERWHHAHRITSQEIRHPSVYGSLRLLR